MRPAAPTDAHAPVKARQNLRTGSSGLGRALVHSARPFRVAVSGTAGNGANVAAPSVQVTSSMASVKTNAEVTRSGSYREMPAFSGWLSGLVSETMKRYQSTSLPSQK